MPTSQSLVAVAGKQRKSRGITRKAVPPPLFDDDFYLDLQAQDIETPPLVWDSDEGSGDTPSYVKFIFEGCEGAEVQNGVTVTEAKSGELTIDIPPDSPFYHATKPRPFDYEPFSDPQFPHNFLPYRDELTVAEKRVSEASRSGQSASSEMVTLALVTRVSIADTETDVFPVSLDRPIAVDLPVEVDSKFIQDPLTFEEIDPLSSD